MARTLVRAALANGPCEKKCFARNDDIYQSKAILTLVGSRGIILELAISEEDYGIRNNSSDGAERYASFFY